MDQIALAGKPEKLKDSVMDGPGRAGMRQLAQPDPPGPARVWPDINVA